MKIFLILFIIPLMVMAQKGTTDWISPVADVQFTENTIYYYYLIDLAPLWNLQPVFYVKDAFRAVPVKLMYSYEKSPGLIEAELESFVESSDVVNSGLLQKHKFLRAATLEIIWATCGRNLVSSSMIAKIESLKTDADSTIAYESFQVEQLIEILKSVEYGRVPAIQIIKTNGLIDIKQEDDQVIISWKLDNTWSDVKIKITDNTGKNISEIVVNSSENQEVFDTRKLKPGVYIATLFVNGKQTDSAKFTLIK